jgi:small subunit ribosomal protein S9
MAEKLIQWQTVGRRKRAVARIYMRPGKGAIVVNKRPVETYFSRAKLVQVLSEPLVVTERRDAYDFLVTVAGGGLSGQAGAIRLGIARALNDAEPALRPPLKRAGFLTRDAREVERKKYGQPGARRRFQFSKR